MDLIEHFMFFAFIASILCSDNLTEFKQHYCNRGGTVRAACFSLIDDNILFLFVFDMYFEMDLEKKQIINVHKVTDYWPELDSPLSVDAACSTRSGFKLGRKQYIFQKNFDIFIYSFVEGKMKLTTKGDIREYETFGLENYPGDEKFTCGSCFNEEDMFTITAIARSTKKMYYCRYRMPNRKKKCRKSKLTVTPYNIEGTFLRNASHCFALAYDSYDDSNVITAFFDSHNLNIHNGNELREEVPLKVLFNCEKNTTVPQMVVGEVSKGSDFPFVLVGVIAILVVLFLTFLAAFFCFKTSQRSKSKPQGHILLMAKGSR